MAKVGIREIRQHLSRYLRRVVEKREEMEITDRGRSVARLVPIPEAAGRLSSRKALRLSLAAKGKPLSELLSESREQERS